MRPQPIAINRRGSSEYLYCDPVIDSSDAQAAHVHDVSLQKFVLADAASAPDPPPDMGYLRHLQRFR